MSNVADLPANPASQSERIVILDSLRGIALLGILLMNIPYFGMPDPAADNLSVLHELGTINQTVWFVVNWLAQGTMRAIFSMLFGAGVILFVSRLEKRIPGMAPTDYFIRRQLWLLVFGLFDAFILLWTGDILFEYALAGIVIFAFRKLKPTQLLISAAVCLVLMTARENLDFYRHKEIVNKGEAIASLDTTRIKLTPQQQEDWEAFTAFKEGSDSASQHKEMEKNLRHTRGNYSELYQNFSNVSSKFEVYFSFSYMWDVLLFMFVGMAFFKTGLLTGEASFKSYWLLFVVGTGIGLFISYFRLQNILQYKFNDYEYAKHASFEFMEISRTIRSFGLFGFIMLLYKSGCCKWFFSLMRPVGQMAFTNYLMQSVLGGLYFYGVGFGMYGKLQRYEIYYVLAVIWIIEIIWSHIWLRFFRFGPLEWAWRSLTYWKRQPLRRF
jgi:uncharacterized protein